MLLHALQMHYGYCNQTCKWLARTNSARRRPVGGDPDNHLAKRLSCILRAWHAVCGGGGGGGVWPADLRRRPGPVNIEHAKIAAAAWRRRPLRVSECGSPTTAYASSTREALETNQAFVGKVEGKHEVGRRVQDKRADNPSSRCSGVRLRYTQYRAMTARFCCQRFSRLVE
ncbi:hypothetical protein LZ30DRAFT_200457 [Colletotrichum cereale]|nr:hypothetical protein LZ30DRAFT_200457 [Colletotrichum cereale]